MPAPYCTISDIKSILSSAGVVYAVDDDRSGGNSTEEINYANDCIERADAHIQMLVQTYYDVNQLPGNIWVKWCSATLAAVDIMTRRGEQVPSGLVYRWRQYQDALQRISIGQLQIPGAEPRASQGGLLMSNLELDQRYHTARVRIVPHTSAGERSSLLPQFHSNRIYGPYL